MSALLCPLLMQARASIPLIRCRADVERVDNDRTDASPVTDGSLYPIPAVAPGVACIGSRCMWWEAQTGGAFADSRSFGRCAQAQGAAFRRDPADGGAG